MADLCTHAVSPNSCSHYYVTIGGRQLLVHTGELAEPLSDDEKDTLYRLALRHRGLGAVLAQLAGRVVLGEEATNVKSYDIIAAGASVTKTNIGTSYVDVLPGANGQRALVDFTGCAQFRVILTANLVGTGPFGLRIVRDSDDAVLFENAAIAVTGERELDTDWQALPQAASGLALVRLQAKSQTAGDDPLFRRCVVLVR